MTGAFVLPSWPLATFDQWKTHWELTRRIHLFDAWGTWIDKLTPHQATEESFTNADQRRGQASRRAKFAAANEQRSRDAKTSRQELVTETFPTWMDYLAKRGRPPGHRQFREALRDSNICVSERAARDLIKLHKETGNVS